MKLKEGFALRDVCGAKVVTPSGLGNMNFNKLIHLNSSAALLWENFYGKEFSAEDMANFLVETYGIDLERATTDVAALVESWQKAEVLE